MIGEALVAMAAFVAVALGLSTVHLWRTLGAMSTGSPDRLAALCRVWIIVGVLGLLVYMFLWSLPPAPWQTIKRAPAWQALFAPAWAFVIAALTCWAAPRGGRLGRVGAIAGLCVVTAPWLAGIVAAFVG
jgi:hypothetical protein